MNIEDLVSELVYSRITLNTYDSQLVYSFHDQVSRHKGLTEKQGILAVRILKRYNRPLSQFLNKDVTIFLENPTFRMGIRKINNEKRLSVVEHGSYGRAIKAVFPYNEKIIEIIRKAKDEIGQAMWDKEEKCWIFSANEASIQFLHNLDTFETDEIFQDYIIQLENIQRDMAKYVPMLIIENLTPKLKNCDKNMPDLISNDLISAIFEARKRGVYTWDETISNFIESDEVDPLTRTFLKTDPGEKLAVDSGNYEISRLLPIVAHLLPIMVVIPGGSELENMILACNFFKELGIDNTEMSVMFRLPTTTHEIFNSYIKLNELNSPISENTKVVFVSSKIPKPIFKSGIKFHGILNLGYSNVHYTMRDFIKNHENTIIYSKGKDIKNIQYGFM